MITLITSSIISSTLKANARTLMCRTLLSQMHLSFSNKIFLSIFSVLVPCNSKCFVSSIKSLDDLINVDKTEATVQSLFLKMTIRSFFFLSVSFPFKTSALIAKFLSSTESEHRFDLDSNFAFRLSLLLCLFTSLLFWRFLPTVCQTLLRRA